MRSALPRPLDRLRLPAIVAPMFLTSNPDLVVAACSSGLLGALPALNQRTSAGFEAWLNEIEERLGSVACPAPHAVNLIVHKSNPRLHADLEIVVRHKVPVVITAFGAVREVVDAVHSYGGLIFHDVASRRHAEKVAESGVDGLIALGAGAGGHTGHLSPFAAIAEVRQVFGGLIILAGAMSCGSDIVAARAMGADMVSMGTRFIATREAAVSDVQKQMMLAAAAADVLITPNLTGASATFMRPSIIAAGLDPDDLPHFGSPDATRESKSWRDIWSAGHGVGSISDVPSVAELCDRLQQEYQEAIDSLSVDPFRAVRHANQGEAR